VNLVIASPKEVVDRTESQLQAAQSANLRTLNYYKNYSAEEGSDVLSKISEKNFSTISS